MNALAAPLEAGDRLHLWMRPAPGSPAARLRVLIAGRAIDLRVEGPSRNPLPVAWESPAAGEAALAWDEAAEVSLVYAFTPARVAEDGIRVLWTSPAATVDDARYRIRFAAPFGWINDPNGLCEVEGVTHLFYQHNPHARRWDTMHWGHAISRDGVAWVHQPVALLPREDLVRAAGRQGGAFSGTARPQPDGTLRLFYTDREDDRRPSREWQMTAVLGEGGVAGPPAPLLDARPDLPGYRDDWRDPFVFDGPDGRLKMLLGGADARGSLVLLYETEDPAGAGGWRFVGVLVREASRLPIPAECPCMVRLDGEDLWALIYGLLGSRDEATLRRNLVRVEVGRFDGRRFEPVAARELDFGTDCYAMQVWRAADGPRGIAWAANWTDVAADRDFESAMTLPRRLLWRDGRLLTPPIPAVEGLRDGPPAALAAGDSVAVVDGLAEVWLDLRPGTPFALALDHPTHGLAIAYDGLALRLRHDPPGGRATPDYRAACADLRTLRVFVDVGLVEVYADDGRLCCTKRVDSALAVTAVRLSPDAQAASGCVWRLRAARGRPSAPRPGA